MRKNRKIFVQTVVFVVACFVLMSPVIGKNARYYNQHGWNYLNKSEYYKASLSFRNALRKNPRFLKAIMGLAKTYYKMQLYDQSLDLYRKALKMNRKNWEAHVGIGLNLSAKGRYKAALGFFETAEKLSGGKTDVHYAIASLYYNMGKKIWAKRRLQTVLRSNRFHYDGLLLMARIFSDEKKFKSAEEYIDRAITAHPESPEAYVLKGEIRLQRSIENGEPDYPGVLHACKQALSIQPQNYRANLIAGMMYYLKKEYKTANEAYKTAYQHSKNSDVLYNVAVTSDLIDAKDESLKYFLMAVKNNPLDSILSARLETFLIMNDYKIGHPARIMLSKEAYELANRRIDQHLSEQGIHYLRKTILMNPMNIKAREQLMSYYEAKGFNRFHVEELKELSRIKGDRKYRDKLTAAIIKRRNQLYHKEGYSTERPVRDVPTVLVLDFSAEATLPPHVDGGRVVSDAISFSLQQFGRMTIPGLKSRKKYMDVIRKTDVKLENVVEELSSEIKKGNLKPVDFLIIGDYKEHSDLLSLRFSLMDFHRGVIIGNFFLRDSGREALSRIAIRSARRVYDAVPYKGRILKVKEKEVMVNLGSYDGLKAGDKLVIYKYNLSSKKGRRYAIILKVTKTNTLISSAEPRLVKDLEFIDPRDRVIPLKQRRARLVE